MPDQRVRQRLIDTINGDADNMDPVVRRALVAIADEADGIHAAVRDVQKNIEKLRNTVLGVGGSVVLILVGSAVGVFFR